MKKVRSFLMLASIFFCGFSLCVANFTVYAEGGTQVEKDAEFLYTKIHEFLDATKDYPLEDFENVCVDYMVKSSAPLTVLDKDAFEAQTKSGIKLYRGVSKKKYADDMKVGNFYMGSSIKNVRGSGIYTTTSLACANHYTDGTGEVITLAINKGSKIVEMPYLEEVVLKMREMHPKEFKCTLEENLGNVLYDSMADWIDAQMKAYYKEDYDKYVRGEVSDESLKLACERMQQQPNFSELLKNRKKYYKDKIVAIFYNHGLMARLLGYDALHSVASLRNFTDKIEEEYLILNAGVLAVCK